jgi:hemolysin activation/secretion protein
MNTLVLLALVQIHQILVPDSIPSEVVEPFLGEEISQETLQNLQENVSLFLESEGKLCRVFFPKQDVSSGTVELAVSSPTVKSVKVSGNKWNNEKLYREQITVSPGDVLETDQLLNQVAWYNRNPFRYAELVVAPGEKGADVELLVKDRFPFRPFAGADNTGTDLTSQVRLFAGMNWGKAFGRPDVLTYQYICAPNPKDFFAHSGSYLIFLPWKHELTFFGGYSEVHPKIPNFSQEGISVQASLRYGIPIGQLAKTTKQSFTWGLDYKNINSNVFFIEAPAEPIIAHQANISELYLSYVWQREFLFKAEAFYSPLRLLPHQSGGRYHMLRPHSRAEFAYARVTLGDLYGKPEKISFSWLLRGQVATGPLLPSEQFGLGGYDTVRGYQERDYIADNTVCTNLELRAPKLHIFRKDELIFLAFSDFGAGYNYQSEQSNQTSQFLWSAGAGLRYNIAPYVTFRTDYGFQLHHLLGDHAFGRFHLGGSISY